MYANANPPESTSIVVLLAVSTDTSGWARALHAAPDATVIDPRTDRDALDGSGRWATTAFIDGTLDTPLALARRLRRRLPHLQLVFVAPASAKERLRESMLFTPGLGEPWIVEPAEADAELLERAADVGRRRRDHARRSVRLSEKVDQIVPEPSRRAFLSDQYLATLLELLPEPVIALDERDRVLFANPVAASLFRHEPGTSARRRDVGSLLDPDDPDLLADLLRRGRRSVARAQVALRTDQGELRTFRAAVAPVGGDRPVRVALLHDVTEQVETREKLERQTDRLEEESSRRERLLEERDRALEDLRRLMRRRSRFYANISHELRTPLNAIVGYNDLLLDSIFGEIPEKQRDVLDRIRRASQHLTELIEDLLDLSRIESEKAPLELEEVDVADVLAGVDATMEPLARKHGVELRIDLGEEKGRSFRTDPKRLRRIVDNLVSNAIRFGAGRPVDVRCRREDAALVLEVEDRGPGIPSDQQEEIFEEFVQLDPQGTESSPAGVARAGAAVGGKTDAGAGLPGKPGTGLGLSIARSMARSLDGEVDVASEPGRGSVFTLTLPEIASGEAGPAEGRADARRPDR